MKKLFFTTQGLRLVIALPLVFSCKKDSENLTIYQTDFTTDNNTWYKASTNNYNVEFNNGKYEIEVDALAYQAWAFAPCPLISGNYSASVDCAIQISGVGYAGLMYNHVSADNYKVFQISNNGYYWIYQYLNGQITDIQSPSASTFLKTVSGANNTLELIQRTTSIEFFLNGNSLGLFPQAQEFNFKVGLISSSYYSEPMLGSFDNLVIKKVQ